MTILRELAVAAALEAASLTVCESQQGTIDGRRIDDGSLCSHARDLNPLCEALIRLPLFRQSLTW